jgi:hypothetical protein
MSPQEFLESLSAETPPAGLPDPVTAVWHGLNDDWDRAHELVQAHEGQADADWVHAWLHRDEGDQGNAAYWYRRAGRKAEGGDLKDEGRAIATALLARG